MKHKTDPVKKNMDKLHKPKTFKQRKREDKEKVAELSASQFLEKELGLKVHSIQNIKTIFEQIKDNLEPWKKKLWLDYYKKYGTVKLQ